MPLGCLRRVNSGRTFRQSKVDSLGRTPSRSDLDRAQSLPNRGHLGLEVVLLDRHGGPNLIDEFVLADPFTVGFKATLERFQITENRGPRLYPVPTSLSRAALGALATILNGHGT